MQWCLDFFPGWLGTSLILANTWTPSTSLQLFTDASGTSGWGCLLVWKMALKTLATGLTLHGYNMEGAVCYCYGGS